jgi:hypothetical protein
LTPHTPFWTLAAVTVPSLDDWEKEWEKNSQRNTQVKLLTVDFRSSSVVVAQSQSNQQSIGSGLSNAGLRKKHLLITIKHFAISRRHRILADRQTDAAACGIWAAFG